MNNQFRSDNPKPQANQDIYNRRTWNTPLREPWNPVIKHCLNAIDYHIDLYIKTGHPWHLDQAELLRIYVHRLKTWIIEQERLHHTMEDAD